MIQAVFFDYGGVVMCPERAEMRRLEERYGLPEGGLWRAAYEIPEWRELMVGNGTEEVWLEAMGRELDEMAGRPIPGIVEESKQVWRRLDGDVVDLARRLRRRYRVGMISNASSRLEGILRDHQIDHLFEVVVNSAREGVVKPDARIYHLAAERIGVEPAACVHIDDLAHNVEGARQAGFQGIHHGGDYAVLERDLRSLGVEW